MQAPLALVSLLLIKLVVKEPAIARLQEPLDLPGILLFMVWASLLFFGVSSMPSPLSLAAIAVGLGTLVVFVRHLLRVEYPLLRLEVVWANRILSRSVLSAFLVYSSNFPVVLVLSLFLQYSLELSPTVAGQVLIIQAVVMMMVAPAAGPVSDRYGPRIVATLGCLVMTTGFASLWGVDATTSVTRISLAMGLLGLGMGMFTAPNNSAALGSVPQDRLGTSSALMHLARNMGNLLGTASFLLLVSLLIGAVEIDLKNSTGLERVMSWLMGLSCIYSLVAAWLSFSRGRVINESGV